jgi:pimeloyl-ACP methyl ester carboxylesterase
MSRFVLIHGGLHDAWCWHLLEPELQRLGHETVSMDLPVDRPGQGLDAYAETVLAAMPPGEALLVGHSLGGFVAPRVAAARPECRIVMLCAGFPPTCAAERILIHADDFPGMIRDDLDRIHAPAEIAVAAFYDGVPADLAQEAARRLRPQWIGAFTDTSLVAPYAHRVAAVIACANDGIAPVADQRERARGLFDLDPVILPGGHSPFLACPQALALALDAAARVDRASPDL